MIIIAVDVDGQMGVQRLDMHRPHEPIDTPGIRTHQGHEGWVMDGIAGRRRLLLIVVEGARGMALVGAGAHHGAALDEVGQVLPSSM